MAQSVSNDALWEKLSEIDKKLDQASLMQKTPIQKEEPEEINPDFKVVKDEIITEIKEQSSLLGNHSDINFGANKQNIQMLDENIRKVLNVVSHIRKQQKETIEPQTENKDSYFNLKFFKVRKSSFLIAILGLLVFILTLFCMKQQNDYSILNSEYYIQQIVIREMQVELDSIRSVNVQKMEKMKIKK